MLAEAHVCNRRSRRPDAAGKKISHAYLGISMLSLTPAAARLNNDDPNSNVYLPEQYGALVLAVGPDTPAARAGFRKFDLITEIGGTAIKSAADAQELVDKAKVRQEARVHGS
eukprot:scaffold67969_cov31-Tisochrysis_lutea.AAC.3